jgi:hypothetical protein
VRVDVDAILRSLPAEFDDPGIDPWGGANLAGVCNRCRCVIVRENTPWNREWRCNGDHRRCTMIGCIPERDYSVTVPPVNAALAVRADGQFFGSPAPEGW